MTKGILPVLSFALLVWGSGAVAWASPASSTSGGAPVIQPASTNASNGSPVTEPGNLGLLALGVAGLILGRRLHGKRKD